MIAAVKQHKPAQPSDYIKAKKKQRKFSHCADWFSNVPFKIASLMLFLTQCRDDIVTCPVGPHEHDPLLWRDASHPHHGHPGL